jgi:hypothetical protein
MNKITAFIVVAIVVGLGYWSYNSSVKDVIPVDTNPVPIEVPVVSDAERDIESIDVGDDVDSSMQEIDNDLNNL